MKILFLDHDGPLVLREKTAIPALVTSLDQVFEKHTVDILNEILEKTGAEIVVTSDWRLNGSKEWIKEIYKKIGVNKIPIDATSTFWKESKNFESLENIRSREILYWLDENYKLDVTHWVAVDDMNLPLRNFVQTDKGYYGITDENVKNKIIEILNSP